jgi:hypothetical protein
MYVVQMMRRPGHASLITCLYHDEVIGGANITGRPGKFKSALLKAIRVTWLYSRHYILACPTNFVPPAPRQVSYTQCSQQRSLSSEYSCVVARCCCMHVPSFLPACLSLCHKHASCTELAAADAIGPACITTGANDLPIQQAMR